MNQKRHFLYIINLSYSLSHQDRKTYRTGLPSQPFNDCFTWRGSESLITKTTSQRSGKSLESWLLTIQLMKARPEAERIRQQRRTQAIMEAGSKQKQLVGMEFSIVMVRVSMEETEFLIALLQLAIRGRAFIFCFQFWGTRKIPLASGAYWYRLRKQVGQGLNFTVPLPLIPPP